MDVDLDFEQSRRHETIKYILDKYPGQTARVASYGLYKVDNLVNDLAKVCGLKTDKTIDSVVVAAHKTEIRNIKTLCNIYIGEGGKLNSEGLLSNSKAIDFNSRYDNIITHFTKMYKKIRYVGTHAAGVAITGGNIYDYTALRVDKDGDVYSNYDLNDLDLVKLVKFDCLGLITMEEIGELRSLTGEVPDYDRITQDEKVIEAFGNGESQGVFQFDNKSVRQMLVDIECDCFADVVAANAMNRPGPLKSGMPDKYMAGKSEVFDTDVSDVLQEYTSDSYGTVIYQEQVQQICVNVGGMSWVDADKVMKMDVDKANAAATKANKEKNELREKFIAGAVKNGMSKSEAKSAFEAMMVYSFNKGHATGYSLISAEEMFYKVHYPTIFWYCKIKYAPNKDVYDKYCAYAVKSGCVVFLPHINYSEMRMSMREVDGAYCLQQGLTEVLDVGEKAGIEIYEERMRHGAFKSFDDFCHRCKSRAVTVKVIKTLVDNGVAQFDENIYLRKVVAYNSALWMRAEK